MKNCKSINIVLIVMAVLCVTAGAARMSFADVIINVLAINGAPEKRETPIRFVLPPDVQAKDIVDTDGLIVDYDVNEGAYVAQGTAELDSKASRTFRIKVKDIWQVTTQDVELITQQVQEAYEKLGNIAEKEKTALLKDHLLEQLNFVVSQQNANSGSVEKRIDSYRIYRNRLDEIKRESLSVDYWRSDPAEIIAKQRIVRMVIEVEKPANQPAGKIEEKYYMPSEVKPEYIINREDFEIKYDETKQRPYLYKEEDFEPGQKKRYEISIKDVWYIPTKDVDYLNQRSTYALNFLKESRFEKTAQYLFDRCQEKLNTITDSQQTQREIREHISAYRANTRLFDDARRDVEDLEKLVAIYREELDKSKVTNVLRKIRALDGVADFSDSIFKKKPSKDKAWDMFGWILLFVGGYTIIHFAVWMIRSGGTKKK